MAARLHANQTDAGRSRQGQEHGRSRVRADEFPEMSGSADAIFQQVLDGIMATSLVQYAELPPIKLLPSREPFWREQKSSRAPGWSMPGRPRAAEPDDAPGPGHYGGDGVRRPPRRAPRADRPGRRRLSSPPSPRAAERKAAAATPGPGAYDVGRSALSLRARSPTPVKMLPPKKPAASVPPPTPGPGAYEAPAPEPLVKSGALIGTAPRQRGARSSTPGPGEYDPKAAPPAAVGTPRFRKAVKKRRRPPSVATTPGPGQYEALPPLAEPGPRGRGFSWGSSGTGRQAVPSPASAAAPGPGAYDLAAESPRHGPHTPRGWSFGTAPKPAATELPPPAAPGPGAYDSDGGEARQRARSAVILPPAPRRPRPAGPGPGTYDTADAFEPTGPRWQIGTAPRASPVRSRSAAPGPGHYDPDESAQQDRGQGRAGYSFGHSRAAAKRSSSAPPANTPGPGAYDAAAAAAVGPGVPAFGTAPQRPRTPPRDALPGPGSYDAAPGGEKQAHYFARAATGRDCRPAEADTPGPGAYDASVADATRLGAPLLGGTEDRGLLAAAASSQPGPGNYDAPPVAAAPGGVVPRARTGRSPARRRDAGPGPGQYDAADSATAPAHGFGTAPRSETAKKDEVARREPGPGSYNPAVERPGGLSFPVAAREQPLPENTPGPGQYETAARQEARPGAGAFGTAPRGDPSDAPPSEAPGPGAYHSTVRQQTAAHSFAKADRGEPQPEPAPGPGTYDVRPRDGKRGPSLGTAAARPQRTEDAAPGPGTYEEPRVIGADARAAVVRGRVPEPAGEAVPGPGAYDTAAREVGGVRIGSAARAPTAHAEPAPGPGSYDAPSGLDARAARLYGRPSEPPAAATPGPGAYDALAPLGAGVAAPGFGVGDRPQPPTNPAPGPGAYDVAVPPDGPVPSIGTVLPAPLPPPVPGPGSYWRDDVHPFARGGAVGTAPRLHHGHQDADKHVPGPGSYDADPKRRRAPQAVLLPPHRDQLPPEVPGPGSYDPQQPDSAVGVMMGTAPARVHTVSDVPGPGDYDDRVQPAGPKWSMAPRRPDASGEPTPGPGTYETALAGGEAGAMIGTAPRTGEFDLSVDRPGPGAYDPAAPPPGPSAVIGGVGRQGWSEDPTPGPGAYTIQERAGRAAALAGRDGPIVGAAVAGKDAPGPGAYDVGGGRQGPEITIAGRPAEAVPEGPGPGAYDAAEGRSAHAAVLGTATRGNLFAVPEGAAPGDYDVPQPDRGPRWTVGARHGDPLPAATPGPGSYDRQAPAVSSGAAVSLTAARPELFAGAEHGAQMPGPGAYDAGGGIGGGPSAVLTARPRDPAADPAPGPGEYDRPAAPAGPSHSFAGRPHDYGAGTAAPAEAGEKPGPGAYSPRRGDGGRAATIAPPAPDYLPDPTPGPGAYESADGGGGPPPNASRFGTEARQTERWLRRADAGDTPGPAAHDLPKLPEGRQAAIGAPRGEAPELRAAAERPGPGEYESGAEPLGSGKPAAIVTSRARPPPLAAGPMAGYSLQGDMEALPGPGHYVPFSDGPRGPQVSINQTAERRCPLVPVDEADRPGPGYYTPAEPPRGPAATITGRHPTYVDDEDAPGPGHYHNEAKTIARDPSSQGVSMAGKEPEILSDPTPAPGHYHRPTKPGADAYHATLVGRPPPREDSPAPGPADYHSAALMSAQVGGDGPAAMFGRERRADPFGPARDEEHDVPSPGRYHRHVQWGEGRGARIVGGWMSPPFRDEPGPGQYHREHEFGDNVPRADLGGNSARPDLFGETEGPGPGAFRPVHAAPAVQTPATMGKTRLPVPKPPPWYTRKDDDTSVEKARRFLEPHVYGAVFGTPSPKPSGSGPGPGQYEVSQKLGDGAPRASIVGRPSRGSFDMADDDREAIDPSRGEKYLAGHTTGPDIGGRPAPRRSSAGSNAPGPGEYETAQPLMGTGGPRASIIGRAAEKEEADVRNYDVERAEEYLRDPVGARAAGERRGSGPAPAGRTRRDSAQRSGPQSNAGKRDSVHPSFVELQHSADEAEPVRLPPTGRPPPAPPRYRKANIGDD